MKDVFVPCSYCDGYGVIELTGVYAETLRILRRFKRPVVAGSDAESFGCKPTALNNRLAWLESKGLARSAREGKKRKFWAT